MSALQAGSLKTCRQKKSTKLKEKEMLRVQEEKLQLSLHERKSCGDDVWRSPVPSSGQPASPINAKSSYFETF